jgi:hypothetical protein
MPGIDTFQVIEFLRISYRNLSGHPLQFGTRNFCTLEASFPVQCTSWSSTISENSGRTKNHLQTDSPWILLHILAIGPYITSSSSHFILLRLLLRFHILLKRHSSHVHPVGHFPLLRRQAFVTQKMFDSQIPICLVS